MKKHISRLLLIQLFLLAVYCAPAQSRMYRGSRLPQVVSISGIIDCPRDLAAFGSITVDLYRRNDFTRVLQTVYVNSFSGRFKFFVTNGSYVVIVKAQNFEDKQIFVDVMNADVSLERIRLFRLLN